MTKKAIVRILPFLILLGMIIMPINADEANMNYYQETGQINLTGLTIIEDPINGDLNIIADNDILSYHNKRMLINEMNGNPLCEDILKIEMQNGTTPEYLGYTRIYLKEVSDKGSVHLEPMTTEEYIASQNNSYSTFAIGPTKPGPYGNITLYTGASYNGNNIYANSYASFQSYSGMTNSPCIGYYDYIGISFPDVYTLQSGFSVVTPNYGQYVADETDEKGVVGVMLKASPSAAGYLSANLAGIGLLNGNAPSYPKIISSYTHNYYGLTIDIEITDSDNFIKIPTLAHVDKSWTFYSSVTLGA